MARPFYQPPSQHEVFSLYRLLYIMTRPSKRIPALRALGNSRKKLKIINSEPNPESDQESEIEEPPINIPDLPKLENDDAFTI